MEYEFIHDSSTGIAKAKFSFEHQVLGPWLEVEIGEDINKLTNVLTALMDVKSRKSQDVIIIGCEYSLRLSADDIYIQPNAVLNSEQTLPVELDDDQLDFDDLVSTCCGSEDFTMLLMSWAKFTQMNLPDNSYN
jgi:hypothetical protein